MRLDTKTLIGVSILICIFSTANYYIFSRLNLWLSLGWGWQFNAFGALLGCYTFIFILWHLLSVKIFYRLAAFWFGFVYFLFVALVVAELIANFIAIDQRYLAFATLLFALGVSIYASWNHLSGRKVIVINLRSSKIQTPLRIVLIADTHISQFHSAHYLAGIVGEINSQNPDVVCISGDFADGGTDISAIEPLNEINAPVYLVMGNHEVWNNHNDKVVRLLNKTKAIILDQSNARGVQFFGLHYHSKPNGLLGGLEEFEIDSRDYNILLYHEPKDVDIAWKAGIDLMLSGHTHGGQIVPWNWVTRLAYKYIKGLYNHKGMLIYVSQGTGVWGPPMRLGSENEITVIDLKPKYI